jgi:hypothetical protein
MWIAAVVVPALFSSTRGLGQAAPTMPTRTSLEVHDGAMYAQVTNALGQPVNAGVVSFNLGQASGVSLGATAVDAQGRAVLPLPSLPGQAKVTAAYAAADGSLMGSRSAPAMVSAQVTGVPDFSITAAPASITATQGNYATTVLTVTPINDFSESVTLSCSGLPAQATCSFTPVIGSTAPTGTGTQPQAFTSILQISTEAASGAVAPPDFGLPGRGVQTALAVVFPGLLAIVGLASGRRRWLSLAAMAILGAGVLGLGGCSQRYGYLKHPPTVAGGTPLGTYTVTIAASGNSGSSVTNHNISLMLTVAKP